jgi:protein O-mannosyl-transferase
MTKITKATAKLKDFDNLFIRKRWAILIIALLSLIVYSRTFSFGFLPLDDWDLIIQHLDWYKHKSNLPLVFTKAVFEGSDQIPTYYRPTLILSFMIDTIMGGGDPYIYHFTNVLLHILSSILCFLFLLKLIPYRQTAFLFSLFFAVHPVFAHAVAWIPGRNDTLLAIFVLACILFFINFLQSRKWYHFALHILFFFLALLTKENAIVLLPLLILYYWLFHEKRSTRVILAYTFVWLLLMTGWFLLRDFILKTEINYAVFDFQKILLDASQGFFIFVGKMILPINQSVLPTVVGTTIYIGIIVIAALIAIAIKYKISNYPKAVFGITWFLLFLIIPLSMATIDKIVVHHEHRLYVPMIGFILFLSCLQLKIPYQSVWIVLLLCLFAVKTFVRTGVYQDSFAFTQAAVKESPDLSMSYNLRGFQYLKKHDFKQAVADFSSALKIDSLYVPSFLNLGTTNLEMGNPAEAIAYFNRALKIDKHESSAYYSRGDAYLKLNNIPQAISDYTESINIDPEKSEAFNNRGNAYLFLKQYDKAITDFDMAILKDPKNDLAYRNRAIACLGTCKYDEALSDIKKAIAIKPSDDFIALKKQIIAAMQHSGTEKSQGIPILEQQLLPIALEYLSSNKYEQAIDIFKQLEADAQNPEKKKYKLSYMNNIGICYLRMGRTQEAEQQFKQIITLDPNYDKAYANLGLLNTKIGDFKVALAFYKSALKINPLNTAYEAKIAQLGDVK